MEETKRRGRGGDLPGKKCGMARRWTEGREAMRVALVVSFVFSNSNWTPVPVPARLSPTQTGPVPGPVPGGTGQGQSSFFSISHYFLAGEPNPFEVYRSTISEVYRIQ